MPAINNKFNIINVKIIENTCAASGGESESAIEQSIDVDVSAGGQTCKVEIKLEHLELLKSFLQRVATTHQTANIAPESSFDIEITSASASACKDFLKEHPSDFPIIGQMITIMDENFSINPGFFINLNENENEKLDILKNVFKI